MSDHSHDAHEHHVTSVATLVATFVALVALTVATSALSFVNLGRADIWVTLGIATLKAALVATIFMHLIHDKAFNGIILLGTILFGGLFIGFTLMDSRQYSPEVEAYSATVEQQAYADKLMNEPAPAADDAEAPAEGAEAEGEHSEGEAAE